MCFPIKNIFNDWIEFSIIDRSEFSIRLRILLFLVVAVIFFFFHLDNILIFNLNLITYKHLDTIPGSLEN